MSDTDITLEHLAARIKRQERLAYRCIVLGLMIVSVGTVYALNSRMTLTADSVTAKNLTAETIVLRNGTGKTVAQLLTTADGTPHILLFDDQEKLRLHIGLRRDGGPSVSLLDTEQGARAVLSLNDKQDATLSISNAAKVPRAVFGSDAGDSGHMVLYGTGGGLNLSATDGRVQWTPVGGTAQNIPTQK